MKEDSHWIEINKKRIREAKSKSSGRFPSFAYNFKMIRIHWQQLQSIEDAVEYLDRVKGQFKHDQEEFITNLILEMDGSLFFSFSISPEESKEDKELWDRFFFKFAKWLGVERDYITPYIWLVQDEETGKYHFSNQVTSRFFEGMFGIEKKEIHYSMNCGDLPRRDELQTTNQAETTGDNRNSLWLKFHCPKDNLKIIEGKFQELAHKGILKLPENFVISNYFSTSHEKKNKQTLEAIIDWNSTKDLAGFVAFIEILEKDYGVKTQPIQIRNTFTIGGEKINTGSFNTYRSSKPASDSFKKREAIERRKTELRVISG